MKEKRWMKWPMAMAVAAMMFGCGGDDDEPSPGEEQEEAEAPGETLASSLERELSPQVEDQDFAQFTADNRDFSFSLLHQLLEEEGEDENIFFSPHSISIALAMTYAGARENTKEEMAQVLRFHLDDEVLHPAFNKLDLELAERSEVEVEDEDDEAFDLDIVNQTWGQKEFEFLDEYLDLLALNYGASMRVVDFAANYEEIRKEINQWVEDRTNDRIQDLLPEDSLSALTRFVLVNAIYFYGSWKHPFNDSSTADADFHLLDDTTVEVPLMTNTERFGYYKGEDTIAASLPYVGDQVSLVAVMPAEAEEDFLEWEANFARADFDDVVEQMTTRETRVFFPRFEDEGAYGLAETFEEMGMVDAFDDCEADFSGITGAPPCTPWESLFISDILHKSFVSVDEEGTEAAAATAVIMDTLTDSEPEPPPVVRFDRPFYYVIYDHPTDTILFMGRMVDPS